MAAAAADQAVFSLISTALDPDFYRSVYPDVAQSGAEPCSHYAHAGWREGRDPAPWFSTRAYLAAYPEIEAAGTNPFAHFLAQGRREGREIQASDLAQRYYQRRGERTAWTYRPDPPQAEPPAPGPGEIASAAPLADHRELVEPEFDPRFYLAENPDVADGGGDPLDHFLTTGWREGRDPAPWFSVSDYLDLNPDIAAAGVNPFVHYLQAGRREGRMAKLELGFRYRVLSSLTPLAERMAAAAAFDEPHAPGAAEDLRQRLSVSRSGLTDLHLTVSHDDFAANLGGVQLCLQRESAAAAASGRDHLHLYPANSRPMLRPSDQAELLGLLWNGEHIGHYPASLVAEVLEAALEGVAPGRRSLAIHSLLGHAVSDVLRVVRAAGFRQGWFWVHDFASACASYHLLRNDVADCGAPPPDSAACGVCLYGEARRFHMDEHRRLFEALKLSVAAPSQAALDTWRRGANLPAVREVVAPLARLVPRGMAETATEGERPFRLAFPGLPSGLKGWPVFRDLVLRFAEDPRYEFLHLARDDVGGLPTRFHPVTVSETNPRAMQDAIEALEVDAVMIWSICRETFSFTTHEAAASGAAILTGPDSGNVAAFVQATGLGRLLESETALFDLFETGEVLQLARARRAPQLSDLVFSSLTIDLLDEEAGQ